MSEIDTDIETPVDAEVVPEPADAPAEGEAVDYVPFEATVTGEQPAASYAAGDLERLHDVPVELAVEIGRTRMTIGETLALGPGSIITLNRLAGEPVDLLVNGKPIARGEVVVIDEEFGLRVTEVVTGGRRPDPDAE
jgi:flagellar motor switch protein FliN